MARSRLRALEGGVVPQEPLVVDPVEYQSECVEGFDVRDLIGPLCNPGEAWAELAVAALDRLPATDRVAWNELLAHATLMPTSRPTQTWRAAHSPLWTGSAPRWSPPRCGSGCGRYPSPAPTPWPMPPGTGSTNGTPGHYAA